MSVRKYGIIGGGISGLTVGNLLHSMGAKIRVFDKGNKIGGRFATRGAFDYGVPSFLIKNESISQHSILDFLVSNWHQSGTECHFLDDYTYIYRRPMRQLCSDLATEFSDDCYNKTKVERLTIDSEKWEIKTDNPLIESMSFDDLICTIPIPQLLSLLRDSELRIVDASMKDLLRSVRYYPQFTVMIRNDCDTNADWNSDHSRNGIFSNEWQPTDVDQSMIDCVLINDKYVTIYSDYQYALDRFNDDPIKVGTEILNHCLSAEFSDTTIGDSLTGFECNHCNDGAIFDLMQVHKWRYSRIQTGIPQHLSLSIDIKNEKNQIAKLSLAGDAFGAGHVEGAIVSAIETAKIMSS